MKWKTIMVISACSLAFGATCYAAGGVERIQAYLNHDFKFTLDSTAWTPTDSDGAVLAPVILNGTAYLPAKAIVEAAGGKVQWNEATKTIAITSASGSEAAVSERDQLIHNKMNEIKKKLKLGLTKEEAQALFEEKFEIAHDNGDSEDGSDSYWKYNFFKESGYNRGDIPDHVIDEIGLKDKKIGAYLFIEWKNNQLFLYSIAYVNPKDNRVYLFVMSPDGTISDSPASR
ncbi:copper amine oxidase N-terminal domain-containing protein [Paenibacillus sp. LMG 31456]|uniref:Copper amine oxidase N-terminal domain-containing protein n=1 Tax=Paenibacillus foliorum TaxID=2654974 RepID=A0A972GN44_9BACL|nr:stalk domain-containing protein [Paenibacillus foliorum]NOU93732.1 copper amine oxidase N-terminal domain-containing protein [Paenibacillus foliorum]